jgi:ABC-type uncharacterized transport system fused permease/ATPase subunit
MYRWLALICCTVTSVVVCATVVCTWAVRSGLDVGIDQWQLAALFGLAGWLSLGVLVVCLVVLTLEPWLKEPTNRRLRFWLAMTIVNGLVAVVLFPGGVVEA